MIRLRQLSFLLLAIVVAGCTITETGHLLAPRGLEHQEVCVVEDTKVDATFLPAFRSALEARGYAVRTLPAGAATSACPLTATYYARWSWDFVTYMSHATITVYRDGQKAADALYDAPKAGFSMTTRIYESTESKVATMVSNAFPRVVAKE